MGVISVLAPLWFLMSGASPPGAAASSPSSASQCPPGAALPAPGSAAKTPPPGIPLLLGVETGMSRQQVAKINRWLVASQPSRNFPLAAGLRLRANVNFWGKPPLAVSIEMNGTTHYDETVRALTLLYGAPLLMKDAITRLKWCDGARRIVLAGESENFWVTIAGQDF